MRNLPLNEASAGVKSMSKTEYDAHYFDKTEIATRVATTLNVAVNFVLSATRRDDNNHPTICVFNHYGKLVGHMTFRDVNDFFAAPAPVPNGRAATSCIVVRTGR
jgi:hypothetical protein